MVKLIDWFNFFFRHDDWSRTCEKTVRDLIYRCTVMAYRAGYVRGWKDRPDGYYDHEEANRELTALSHGLAKELADDFSFRLEK